MYAKLRNNRPITKGYSGEQFVVSVDDNRTMNTRTDFHEIDDRVIMSIYRHSPPFFVVVDISKGDDIMPKTLDRIEEDVFEASNDGQMPYIALQAFRLGIAAARQLVRIADALERANAPEVYHLAGDGLDKYRNHEPRNLAEIDAEMERAAAEVEMHECTQPERDRGGTYTGCWKCPDSENCRDYVPF